MNGDTGTVTDGSQSTVDYWFSSGPGGGDWPSLYEPGEDLETERYLTKSETRIASGYVSGMIGKEIADACDISYNTVVRHTQNIYDKTGIKRSTNSLVAWFLSKNYDIDLSDFKRRIGAFVLLMIIFIQMFESDFGSQFIRTSARRCEVRKSRGRRRKEEDDDTYYLF